MFQYGVDGIGAKLVAADRAGTVHPRQLPFVFRRMGRILEINIPLDMGKRGCREFRGDRPRFYQAHVNAAALKLHPQRHPQPLDREFRCGIGAAITIGDEAENGGAMHDPACAAGTHEGNDPPCQIVPAKDIGFELRPQRLDRQIFHRARLAIGAIVEERVDTASRARCHRLYQGGDGFRLGIVHDQRFDALIFQRGHINDAPHGGEDPPTVAVEGAGAMGADARRAACDDDDGLFRHMPLRETDYCSGPVDRSVKIALRKILLGDGTESRPCALYKAKLISHIRLEVTNEMPMNGGDMVAAVRLAGKVAFDAYSHFAEDDGWAMASHMALSILLALFPFLIFGTALAGFLGADQFSETAVHLIFDTWPEAIAGPLAAQVQQVLTIPRGGLLTISVLAAAYFASNGVEALRISLNRAYRVTETRWWYVTRLLSLLYVLIAVVVFTGISIVLVAVPVAMSFAEEKFPWLTDVLNTVSSLGLYGTIVVLTAGLVAAHLWLPAGKRRIWDVWPGILLTMIFWVIGAAIFAYYLSTFANYAATYAGLASVMVVLVFLYMVGVIFMLGAEMNAALMKYKVRQIIRRNIGGNSARREQVLEEPDKPADI